MTKLLQVYRQTRDMPISALYLVIWLRLTCQAGLLSEAQVVDALCGDADGLGELLAAAQPNAKVEEISRVLAVVEREMTR